MQRRTTNAFLAALALAVPSVAVAKDPPPERTTILEFNNPQGAKQWEPGCTGSAKPDRINPSNVKDIHDAFLYPNGCVKFTYDRQVYWVKETAVVHDGAKSSVTNVCERVAAGQGAGQTVEAATMGMGGANAKSCGR